MLSQKFIEVVKLPPQKAFQITYEARLCPIILFLPCIRGPPVIISLVPEERVELS